jgi:hypothetical protein
MKQTEKSESSLFCLRFEGEINKINKKSTFEHKRRMKDELFGPETDFAQLPFFFFLLPQ